MGKKFIVLKDERKVIAEMIEKADILKEVNKKCSKLTGRMIMEIMLEDNIEFSTNPKYKAMSVCSEGDDFIESTGKKIAAKKSDLKFHKSRAKQYKKALKFMEKVTNEIHHMYYDHVAKANKIEEELKDYQ